MAPTGEQSRRPKPKKDDEQAHTEDKSRTDATKEEVDDLLDEIDEVLEANAEEFVRGFVQKGGESRALPLPALPPLWGFATA